MRSRLMAAIGMFLADTIGFVLSVGLALGIRGIVFPIRIHMGLYLRITLVYYALFILVTFLLGLYETTGMPDEEKFKRFACGIFFVGMSMGLSFFVLKIGETVSRVYTMALWILLVPAASLTRIGVRELMTKNGYRGLPVGLLTETREQAERYALSLRRDSSYGIDPVIAASKETADGSVAPEWLVSEEQFKTILKNNEFTKMVYLAGNLTDVERIREEYRGIISEVIGIGEPGDHSEWSGMSFCQFGSAYGMSLSNALLRRRGRIIKRIMDVVLCTIGLTVISPLFLLLMILVKVCSPGPIFFIQPRRGKGGKTFGMIKFRTMVEGAEEKLRPLLESNPELNREWESYQKLKNDPRVTWIGKFLRKTSLDELPQLINILKGEMSLVGPRPIVIGAAVAQYGPRITVCDQVLPGLTGLWQITSRNSGTLAEHVSLDYQYIMTWSIWKDFLIILQTPFAMLKTETS